MGLLSFLFSLEAHLMDIIFETLSFEFQLVVFGLQDALRGAFLFDFFGMLDQEVILLHFSQITFLSDLDQLSVQIRDPPLPLINISSQLPHLLLIPALFQLQMQ